MAIVRFRVGQDPEQSLVKLYTKIMAHPELRPAGCGTGPGQAEVDRRCADRGAHPLEPRTRRVPAPLDRRRAGAGDQEDPQHLEVDLIGGERRQVRVILDPERLEAYGVSGLSIAQSLKQANWRLPAGSFSEGDREVLLSSGRFLRTVDDVREVVVGVREGRSIRLGEVAAVTDGPEELANMVLFGAGPRGADKGINGDPVGLPAVTIAVSKKTGSNAVALAERSRRSWSGCGGPLFPPEWRLRSPATTARRPRRSRTS